MPRKIDTAFVEFLPDFSAFERTADRQLDLVFRDVERTADHATTQIEDQFRDLEREIEEVFNEIAMSGTIDMERLVGVAERTATEMGSDFQRGGEVAENAYAELRRTADVELARMDRSAAVAATATSRRFGAMGLAGSAALLGVGAAAVAGGVALTTFGLTSAAQLEQVQISFNALLGSAEKGEEVFRSLQKFAAVTPFEFPEVAAAAKRFLAFNEQVGLSDDFLQSFLTTVGDLASVTGAGAEGLNRIVLAIGQMAGKGRVQLEELMQIGEAVPGFSAINAIAQELGKTSAETMEMISSGSLDATTGIQALLAGMQKFPGAAGAMEKQSQTLLGVFSTFKDTVGQALADSFKPAIPAIKDALTQITPILGDVLRDIAPGLGGILTSLLKAIGPIVKGLSALLTPLLDALGPALDELIPSLEPLLPVLTQLGVTLAPLIPLLAEFLVAILELTIPLLNLLIPVLKVLTPVFQFLADAVGEFAKWLGTIDWNAVGNDIGGAFTDAWDVVSGFFVGIGRFFKELPDKILGFIKSLPDRFVALIKTMVDRALFAIGVGIGLMIAAIKGFPGFVMFVLTELPERVNAFFDHLWSDAKERTTTILEQVIAFVKTIPGRIMDGITALPGLLAAFFTNAFERAKAIVIEGVDNIVAFVKSIPSRIGNFAMDVGTSIFNFFRNALNSAIGAINRGIAAVDDKLPGVELPRIPFLAHGGVAFGPAMIGEDSRTSPEAALPLGDPRAMAMIRDALGTGTTFSPGSIIINVNVTGDMSDKQAQRVGVNIGQGVESVLTNQRINTAVKVA